MARDNDWKRKRELEDESEELDKAIKVGRTLDSPSPRLDSNPTEEKIIELMDRAEPLIDQLNTLYNLFKTGTEKLPPLERRKQLDQTMITLQSMSKPTLSLQFRFNGLQARYGLHCEKWDKLIRDIEKGKKTPYIR